MTPQCLSTLTAHYRFFHRPRIITWYSFSPSPHSYNLLEEEDPDDFVSVDIPEDISASDIALLPPSDREFAHVLYMYVHVHVCVYTSNSVPLE